MTIDTLYTIHYLLDGVVKHFYARAAHLDDSNAIRLAAMHASESLKGWIALGSSWEVATQRAEKIGVTKVRWNASV
ncbi:hypothetical protein M2401_004852 [Pseudomonas sp. JUb42]|jgi:hypothetical protein|uniref:DUF6555 family protein n=1 Tax=Pseudomonas sp. JUb42 TaxID=2940611 RepID=UPI00216AB158|nr:DUF6555 family protein [Pseudomonas sp. JUb42]MCS3471091.1 hypothetical protein [Pseudomonas sp. JUb42]